jgi:hypothetical protein
MSRTRTFFFIAIFIIILAVTVLVVKLAQGYKIDWQGGSWRATGLLAATSVPDGAKVFIDGKLSSATNTTISLSPGIYEVEIKKDGYSSWMKILEIEKELVTKTDAYLFPTVPDLQALTFTGATDPVLSPDGTKVAYKVKGSDVTKNGIWILDLTDLPLGISREPRLILASAPRGRDFSQAKLEWSPDSKQLLVQLVQIKEENFLIDAGSETSATALVDLTTSLPLIKQRWLGEKDIRESQKLAKLPKELKETLEQNTKDISFSLDETKILYIATASAELANEYKPPLPAASKQKQERSIKQGQIYVYDIKEDRNFRIMEENEAIHVSWFPTAKHLILVQDDKAEIIEYDGINRVTIYSGPFENSFAFPFPGGTRLLILTTLGKDLPPNLYAVSLR